MSKRKKLTPKQIVDAIILYKIDIVESDGTWDAYTDHSQVTDQTTLERAVYKCAKETAAILEEERTQSEREERAEYERLKAKYG